MADIQDDGKGNRGYQGIGAGPDYSEYYRKRSAVLSSGGIDHDFEFALDDVLSISRIASEYDPNRQAFFVQFQNTIMEILEPEFRLLQLIFFLQWDDSGAIQARYGGLDAAVWIVEMPYIKEQEAFLKKYDLEKWRNSPRYGYSIHVADIWDALDERNAACLIS